MIEQLTLRSFLVIKISSLSVLPAPGQDFPWGQAPLRGIKSINKLKLTHQIKSEVIFCCFYDLIPKDSITLGWFSSYGVLVCYIFVIIHRIFPTLSSFTKSWIRHCSNAYDSRYQNGVNTEYRAININVLSECIMRLVHCEFTVRIYGSNQYQQIPLAKATCPEEEPGIGKYHGSKLTVTLI